jgi:carotenoid cleavage dioxygenase
MELETVAHNGFDGTLQGSYSAHPHPDPVTGEHHAVTYEGTVPTEVRYVCVPPAGHVTREVPIAVEHGPFIHDCAFTQRYVLIFDFPSPCFPKR